MPGGQQAGGSGDEPAQATEVFALHSVALPPAFSMEQGYHMDLGIVSTPLAGVGSWITVQSSYMIFLIIDWDILTHAGFGYERIRDALDDEEVTQHLEKAPIFGVPEGQSIFVPFGNVVVAAALPFSDDENSSDHYGAFVSHFILQATTSDKKLPGTKIDMQGFLNKSVARRGKIFSNKFGPEDMLKWIETWSPVNSEGAAASEKKPVEEATS